MKRQLLTAGLAVLSWLAPTQAIAASFNSLYIFGDSLSDTGNVFLTSQQALPPAPPYEPGRFTNGPIWIDRLSQHLELRPTPVADVLLAGATPIQGVNFAYGGATTGTTNVLNPLLPLPALFGFEQQIATFASLLPASQADPKALYILWIGALDYLPSLSDLSFVPETSPIVPTDRTSAAITSLYAKGARQFMVVNLPAVGQTPFILNNPVAPQLSSLSGFIDGLASAHNARLETSLNNLNRTLPELEVTYLDVADLLDRAMAGEFGFTVFDQPCFNQFAQTVCSNQDDYLFWDFNHPSTRAHQQIGELAIAALPSPPPANIPEPASVLGLLSLGVLGCGARRQLRARA